MSVQLRTLLEPFCHRSRAGCLARRDGCGHFAGGSSAAPTRSACLLCNTELDGLREAMASRAVIEQAEGVVMICYGVRQDQAFTVLVRCSSLWNIKPRDVTVTMVGLGEREQALESNQHWLARVMAEPMGQRAAAAKGSPTWWLGDPMSRLHDHRRNTLETPDQLEATLMKRPAF